MDYHSATVTLLALQAAATGDVSIDIIVYTFVMLYISVKYVIIMLYIFEKCVCASMYACLHLCICACACVCSVCVLASVGCCVCARMRVHVLVWLGGRHALVCLFVELAYLIGQFICGIWII